MAEILTLSEAELISDEYERIFAVALLTAFPQFDLDYQYPISSMSGHRARVTVADFRLTNNRGEELFFEVTAGEKKSKRKKRQQKTASLAGLGQKYVTIFGRDIETIKLANDNLKASVISMLSGRYNGKFFSFN